VLPLKLRCKYNVLGYKRISILPGARMLWKVGKAFMVTESQASESYFGREKF
jgi:hypothetical protein